MLLASICDINQVHALHSSDGGQAACLCRFPPVLLPRRVRAARAQDMAWCQEYAMQNRQAMRRLMEEAVAEVTGAQPDHARAVNIHHNFWCAAAAPLLSWASSRGTRWRSVGKDSMPVSDTCQSLSLCGNHWRRRGTPCLSQIHVSLCAAIERTCALFTW